MDTATPVSISVKKMPTAALEGKKSYAAPPQSSMVMVGREVSNSSKSAVECDVCSSARAKTARNFVAVRVEKSATYPTSRHQKRRVQRSSRSTTHRHTSTSTHRHTSTTTHRHITTTNVRFRFGVRVQRECECA